MPLCVGNVQSDVFNNAVEGALLPVLRVKENQWHPVLYVSVLGFFDAQGGHNHEW